MPEDPTRDFGAFLRQARERQGITLREIADRTKIASPVLEALERNDISRLPGGIFSRSFVRAYAREAGINPEEAVRRFVERFPQASGEESPTPYDPNPENIALDDQPGIGRGWRAVGWALPILLVIAYFGFGGRLPFWSEKSGTPAPAAGEQPVIPPPPPSPVLREDVPAGPPSDAAVAPSPPVAPAGGDAGPGAPPSGVVPVLEGSAAPASEAVPEGLVRLTLAPSENCWVSVRSDGASVFAGELAAGTRRQFDLKGEVSLSVGNAGAMAFAINGEAGRPLGDRGQVKTVRFNQGNYRDLLGPR